MSMLRIFLDRAFTWFFGLLSLYALFQGDHDRALLYLIVALLFIILGDNKEANDA